MKKILIIEDDMDTARLLKLKLAQAGYNVVVAFDAITGRTAVVKEMPDLIILDISMPGGNGLQLAEFILERPESCTLPIIVTSGKSDVETKEKVNQLGIKNFFVKPYKLEDLVKIISTLLA